MKNTTTPEILSPIVRVYAYTIDPHKKTHKQSNTMTAIEMKTVPPKDDVMDEEIDNIAAVNGMRLRTQYAYTALIRAKITPTIVRTI